MKKLIYYLPRILSVLIIAFLALFVLEGFGPDFSWQDSLSHLVLTLFVLGVTVVAWKWPKVGGWIFILLGVMYLLMIPRSQWLSGLIIGGMPISAGILFLIGGFRKTEQNN